MVYFPMSGTGEVNLQATISAATSGVGDSVIPHHPITCAAGELYFDHEGVLSCDHTKTEPGDPRTQASLNHSLAILLIEFAGKL